MHLGLGSLLALKTTTLLVLRRLSRKETSFTLIIHEIVEDDPEVLTALVDMTCVSPKCIS
ncbi:hypothetical protein KP509_02G024200 [Ceratopteris richardii]|uniref:Uncharacterized protein n=1 Tax=Ceratopteris richardii TaxID=49495 RepID=A0A8T2VB48_CERRI|nr:hypothetical protein KP509_02G024200 [Ceratopteris richardii]